MDVVQVHISFQRNKYLSRVVHEYVHERNELVLYFVDVILSKRCCF